MNYTVLLPVYFKDKCEYLKDAINSILNQSVPPNEVLILVDGPIGNDLKEILEYYNNVFECVSVMYFEQNRGLGRVLYDGVEMSKNQLIGRMDADDIALPNRFEKQLKYFKENDELVLLGGNVKEFTFDLEEELKIRKVPNTFSNIKKYSKIRNPFNHMTVMFKKDEIISVGNYLDMPLFEDYYLWVRIISAGKLVNNIDEVLVNVRAGDEMVQKRIGISYLLKEVSYQKSLLSMKYINIIEFTRNLLLRGIPRLFPYKIVSFVYNKILRK